MTVKSHDRGNEIEYNEELQIWIYSLDGTPVPKDLDRPCGHCGNKRTEEDHDACLGTLIGLANACCGHGNPKDAYVQFYDGTGIHGEDAVEIQTILKRHTTIKSKIEQLEFLAGAVKFVAQEIGESL